MDRTTLQHIHDLFIKLDVAKMAMRQSKKREHLAHDKEKIQDIINRISALCDEIKRTYFEQTNQNIYNDSIYTEIIRDDNNGDQITINKDDSL